MYIGSFSYQFQTLGTYYYWSPAVDSSGQISMRGTITVVSAEPQTLTVQVKSNAFTGKFSNSFVYIHRYFFLLSLAQSCSFPFNYNSVNYTSCTTDNDTQAWCSPTFDYTGQRLYCTSSGINFIDKNSV